MILFIFETYRPRKIMNRWYAALFMETPLLGNPQSKSSLLFLDVHRDKMGLSEMRNYLLTVLKNTTSSVKD
jgi:hypothetical protein